MRNVAVYEGLILAKDERYKYKLMKEEAFFLGEM
jgi:hypothetical protein